MKFHIKPRNLATAFLLLFLITTMGKAQTPVRVVTGGAGIYSRPDTKYSLNFSAQKGDLFRAEGALGEWVRIQMFSGARRYIKASEVELVSTVPPDDSDPSVLNKLCSGIRIARNRAEEEAMSRYGQQIIRQNEYSRLLFDKYVLDTFRELGIPAIRISRLLECATNNLI